jgi:hypothetical protein
MLAALTMTKAVIAIHPLSNNFFIFVVLIMQTVLKTMPLLEADLDLILKLVVTGMESIYHVCFGAKVK